MEGGFNELVYWHWLAFAAILVVLELVVPGFVFFWFAIAALITGVVTLVLPLSWDWQLLVFGVLSVATVVISKNFIKKHAVETDQPTLNRRGEQHIGKIYVLEQAIENGSGQVKVGDSVWRVEGEDTAAGVKVKVLDINGSSLVVEQVD